MPPEEQATRSAARCPSHPSSPSVALCDSCARALCLRCAVPVRGQVYGPECLAQVLGPDAAAAPTGLPAPPRNLLLDLTGLGLVVAVVASLLPWTRFGQPSGVFGGWGIDPQRWSSLAAYGSIVGVILWGAWRAGNGRRSRTRDAILLGLSIA